MGPPSINLSSARGADSRPEELICAECGRRNVLQVEGLGTGQVLCARCLDARLDQPGFSGFMQAFITPQIKRETCPFCATTVSMVRDSGLMGCPICYEAFPEVARQLSILEPE